MTTSTAATRPPATSRRTQARVLLGSWWEGSGTLPTSAAGAEVCLLLAFLGLRATDLVQLAVAMPVGLARSTNPVLDAATALVYLVESLLITVVILRERKYHSTMWAAIDTATGLLILGVQPFIATSTDLIGTWTAWGFGVSLGMALGAGLGFPKRGHTVTAAALLAGAYLVGSLPAFADDGVRMTVVSNLVAYLGFSPLPPRPGHLPAAAGVGHRPGPGRRGPGRAGR